MENNKKISKTFTISYTESVSGGVFGVVKEIPGAASQGKDLEELKENLKDAIFCILESNRKDAEELAWRIPANNDVHEEEFALAV